MEKYSRRQFIQVLGMMGVGVFICPLGSLQNRDWLNKYLSQMFSNDRSIHHLAAVYFSKRPNEKSSERLKRLLFHGREKQVQSFFENGREDLVHRVITKQHLNDLKNRQAVELEGWLFSRTEARLIALASLVV